MIDHRGTLLRADMPPRCRRGALRSRSVTMIMSSRRSLGSLAAQHIGGIFTTYCDICEGATTWQWRSTSRSFRFISTNRSMPWEDVGRLAVTVETQGRSEIPWAIILRSVVESGIVSE